MTTITTGELLGRVLRAAGVDALYGEALGPLAVTRAPAAVAGLLAAAHQRVHATRAGVHRGDGTLRLAAADGDSDTGADGVEVGAAPIRTITVASADDLAGAVAELCLPGAVEMALDLDLDAPVADTAPAPAPAEERWIGPDPDTVAALARATSVTVLAGPGVVHHGAVAGLHDLAVSAGLGVLNTWGAKGVFDWRSAHHLATVGLQAHDFELAGLGEVELIVATGLDPAESPDGSWDLAPAVHVAPGALAPLAEHGGDVRRSPVMPALRGRLAAVTQQGWTVDRSPLPPTRVTMHYAECLARHGLVAADAGTAGFWVARTFATTRLGGAVVPSVPTPGFAAACVAVARLRRPGRPALAVVDGPVDATTVAVVEAASALGVHVPVEAWSPDGERLDADAHRSRLLGLVLAGDGAGRAPVTLSTDPGQMTAMVDAAGPVVAWT